MPVKKCQKSILLHIQECQRDLYKSKGFERDLITWRKRFLLGLASQYLCAPPLRDSDRFHEEMKFLYYRGVEILNEFFDMTGIFTLSQRLITPDVIKLLDEKR